MPQGPAKKSNRKHVPLKGYRRGEYDGGEWITPAGFAHRLTNIIFGDKLRNRKGWKTVSNGLSSSNDYTWDASTQDVGAFVDFATKEDDGKIAVFEKKVLYDNDGSAMDFDGGKWIDATASQDFVGGFAFGGTFYVFSRDKLYSLDYSAGTKTEEYDWSTAIGSNWGDVISTMSRFGQMWFVSQSNSRVFYSDTGSISIGAGTQVSNQALELEWGVWQKLTSGEISSVDSVERLNKNYNPLARLVDVYSKKTCFSGDNYLYALGASSTWSNGDTIYFTGSNVEKTVSSASSVSFSPSQAITAGDNDIWIDYSGKTEHEEMVINNATLRYRKMKMEITEGATSETVIGNYILNNSGDEFKIRLMSDMDNGFSTAASITLPQWSKITISDTFDNDLTSEQIYKRFWGTYSSDFYETCLDPANDDDCDGHIKLQKYDEWVEALRCTYTSYTNKFLHGNAGYVDIDDANGKIVDISKTRAGLYIFKKNPGSIHLLRGMPGNNGEIGSLELVPVHDGLTAEKGTIQTTRHGVIFSCVNVDEINTYFLPLGVEELDEIPKLTEFFHPSFSNVGNSSYTITFKSAIVEGDTYLLSAYSQSGDEFPTGNDYSYICSIYRDKQGYHGRWSRWSENQKTEFEDDSTDTISDKPVTLGYYEYQNRLFRVYAVANAGNTDEYNYYIAHYGWYTGNEAPVDSVYMNKLSGATKSNDTFDKSFWITLESGWTGFQNIERLNVRRVWFYQYVTNGTMDLSLYKDFDSALIEESFENLSDADGSEKFVRTFTDNYNCQYFKIKQVFKEIEDTSPPDSDEYLEFLNVGFDVSIKIDKGQINETSF